MRMSEKSKTYHEIINSFSGLHVFVIGDLILDIYLKGTSTRLTPEAPVPVVDVIETKRYLGGAANTVCNLHALGARVSFCTVIGADPHGEEALKLFRDAGIDTSDIIQDPSRETMVKTRVVSGHQVITRIDQGKRTPLSTPVAASVKKVIEKAYGKCDALIISDYDKGFITNEILDCVSALKSTQPKFIAVDSKRLSYFARISPSLTKPNYEEVIKLIHLPAEKGASRIAQVQEAGKLIQSATNSMCTVVTLDAEGSIVFQDEKQYHTNAPQINTPCVSGAGDTYLSAFALTMLISSDVKASAAIATTAACIAINKESTATCSGAELQYYFMRQYKCVIDHNDLHDLCEQYRKDGRRIVFTNGCFDILHSGHVTYLHCAKELGDVLIVGLNTDESIRRIKGETRPVNSLEDRMNVISALASVDHVIPFGTEQDDTPISLIEIVRPDIFVKGGDYSEDKLPEAATVKKYGGHIVFVAHIPDRSTTRIISKIKGEGILQV
jgi:D-beta-D-heptose 7-phosphate kinase / D-beta-D-heptose 1-phosphate adenosyltransferase